MEKLDIDYYYKLYVSENSIPVTKIFDFIPEGVILNQSKVYKGFGNISNKSISMCEYNVNYSVLGEDEPTTETTTVNTCENNGVDNTVTLTANDKKVQVFSTDLSVRGLNTNAALQFNGYYDIVYNWDQTVTVPNTSAFTSILGIILSVLVIGTGVFISVW